MLTYYSIIKIHHLKRGEGKRLKNCVLKDFLKKSKKNRKKGLTKAKVCGRIVKLSAGAGSEWSLKIEQQERSTKHCKCNTDLVRVY